MRDKNGSTMPRLLEMTDHPIFLAVNIELSCLINLVCEQYSLPQYYRQDNFHKRFCHQLHPQGVIPAWRVAISQPDQFLQVHEDSKNETRPLMSPVGVFSRLVPSIEGPLRLTKLDTVANHF
jgi:hypothetical protein